MLSTDITDSRGGSASGSAQVIKLLLGGIPLAAFAMICFWNGFSGSLLYARLASAEDPRMPMIIEHLSSDDEYVTSVQYMQQLIHKKQN
jgi:hypothetical protein